MAKTQQDVQADYDAWMKIDKDPKTREELETLMKEEKYDEIHFKLNNRMTFGTAGLRGRIAAGYICMNIVTVQQASQGLCQYVKKMVPNAEEKGVVIGHDARYYSHDFARIAAACFLKEGIPVRLYSDIVPTPFVPYAVKKYSAACGIMVTASHNPAADNGYKVYWSDGVQITEPHDKGIQDSIIANLDLWDVIPVAEVDANDKVTDIHAEVMDSYYKDIQSVRARTDEENAACPVRIAYSAMHGVGYKYAMRSLESYGFNTDKMVVPVKAQVQPDPAFPTTAFPNPEIPERLTVAIKEADEAGVTVIFANDPDADRLAVAEKTELGWRSLHGNQIGVLLADWLFQADVARRPDVTNDKRCFVNSLVSTNMLGAYAKANGAQYAGVLTGFKWIGRECARFANEGVTPILGFEEAIGFMCGPLVFDKDGISAAGVMAELTAATYAAGNTLFGRFKDLQKKYGYFMCNNSFFICHEKPVIDSIFARLRAPTAENYMKKVGRFTALQIRDLTTGLDTNQADQKAILPLQPGAHMITYWFDNGAIMTLRTSGTEPKIKWYAELGGEDPAKAQAEIDELVEAMKEEWLEPEKNGLQTEM